MAISVTSHGMDSSHTVAAKPWQFLRLGAPRITPRRDALAAGTRIGERLTIKSFLGEGGFGFTYKAEGDDGVIYAVKECFPSSLCRRNGSDLGLKSLSDQEKVADILNQFKLEAEVLSDLDHKNVVSGGERIDENETAYIVMHYLQGRRLDQVRKPMLPKRAARFQMSLLRQLLDGLGHVHTSGFLHNDISPENVIYASSKAPVLIDFGTSSPIEKADQNTRTADDLLVVKPGYSPPEFYTSGFDRTRQSDIYQLGATLIGFLNKERPPEGMQRLMQIARTGKDAIGVRRASRGREYDRFIDSLGIAVATEPGQRFETVDQWVEYLDG